jgi:hypothetical protein
MTMTITVKVTDGKRTPVRVVAYSNWKEKTLILSNGIEVEDNQISQMIVDYLDSHLKKLADEPL